MTAHRFPTIRSTRRLALSLSFLTCVSSPLWAQITAEVEPNNTSAQATGPVTAGVFVAGVIDGAADVDFYSYTVPGTGKLSVGVHGGAGATFSWTLRNSLGTVVAESNSGGRPELATITVPAGSAGDTHTIEVRRETVTGPASQQSPYALGVAYINASARPTKPGSITNYFTGTSADSANDPVGGPAMMLMGGGVEVDNQFRDFVWPVINRGNIVVVRRNNSNGYQSYFNTTIPNLVGPGNTPASVETIVIDSTAKANDAYTSWVLSRAEMVWFAGGDQSQYINNYENTTLIRAVHQAYMRGAVIGGTSAGAMILGQYIYDPDSVTAVTSAQAINNPYHPSILFTLNLFRFPIMRDLIVETHTEYGTPTNPLRLGRLATFMARLKTDFGAGRIIAIAPDDSAGVFVNSNLIANAGSNRYSSWILAEDSTTNLGQCVSGQPLAYSDLIRWMAVGSVSGPAQSPPVSVPPVQTYNLNNGTKVGGSRIRVSVASNVYTPSNWYAYGVDDPTAPVALTGFELE